MIEAGEGMTEGRDIAAEGLGECRERSGAGLKREPGDECARLGGQSRAAGGEQLFLAQAIAAADVGHYFIDRGCAPAGGFGLEDRLDEILLTHHAGIRLSAVERVVVPFGLALLDETGVAGAGSAEADAELPQHPVGGEPRQSLVTEIGPVTTIDVSSGLPDHAGAHRVEVDVAHQGESVAVAIDEKGLEAALEKMTCPFAPRVDVARITEGEVLHAGGEGLIARLEGEMQMIGHEAEGVHRVAKPRAPLGHEFVEVKSIVRREEDRLAGVAAQDDVVEAAGDVEARFAGHGAMVVERRTLCN